MLTVFKEFGALMRYLWLCVRYNVKSSVSNKKSFIIQTIAMFLNNSVFILFWNILFSHKGGNINGVGMSNILYLWSIPTIGYGIAFFCFGGINNLCRDIKEGNLDIYLTKPKNSLISELTSDSVLSAMGDLIFGIVCGVISVNFNPIRCLTILGLGIISGIILIDVMVIIKLLAFWLGDITSVTNRYIHSLLITLTIYPEQMFPMAIKAVMYTAIPAMYVAHIPVRIITEFNIIYLLIIISVMIFVTIFTFWLYSKGLKKYESGNGITRR